MGNQGRNSLQLIPLFNNMPGNGPDGGGPPGLRGGTEMQILFLNSMQTHQVNNLQVDSSAVLIFVSKELILENVAKGAILENAAKVVLKAIVASVCRVNGL